VFWEGKTMAMKWQKPVLVGGISLSLALWMWQSWQQTLGDVGGMTLWGVVVVYTGYRWFKRQQPKVMPVVSQAPVNSEKVLQAIAATQKLIQQLQTETINPADLAEIPTLETELSQFPDLDRSALNLMVTGGKGVGKTTLINLLVTSPKAESAITAPTLTYKETPALFAPDSPHLDLEDTLNYDLVLFLTNGDLTDTEWQTLAPLAQQQSTCLVFNKQDQYEPIAAAKISAQLQQRVGGLLPPIAIVGVSAAPRRIKVVQEQGVGETQSWLESPDPDIASLTTKLQQVINQERQQLVLATTFRRVQSLQRRVIAQLHQGRCDRSQPIIEQYQWLAAATAFANPVPMLDLLATGAINAQLIMDLGQVHQQKISLAQAENAVGVLAELLIKLGVVEFSTQTIGHLLKSNALTYVAGGLIQGASAAYLTRVSGLSLIAYFQENYDQLDQETTPFNGHRLQAILQRVYQQNQLPALQGLIQQATQKLVKPLSNPQPE
jgi:uncharacterized protein